MKKYSSHIIIILLNVITIIGVFNLPFKVKFYGDQVFHDEAKIAGRIIAGDLPLHALEITRAPGPVLFYAIPYALANPDNDRGLWINGVVWNIMMICLASLCLCSAVNLLTGDKRKLLPIVLLMIIPLQLYYGLSITAETMAFCGCCFYLFGIVRYIKGYRGFVSSVAGLVMIILARPNAILILAFIPALLAWLYTRKNNELRLLSKQFLYPYITTCVIFLAVTMTVKALPSNRQETNQENLFLLVCHHGRFQFRTEETDWRFWDSDNRPDSKDYIEYTKSIIALDEEISSSGRTYNEVYREWLINDITTHPLSFIKQGFIRIVFGNYLQINSVSPAKLKVGPFSGKTISFLIHLALNLVNLLIIGFAVFGLVRLYKENKAILLVLVPYFALILFHAFIYMEQRYLFPARPMIILLGSFGLIHFLSVRSNRRAGVQDPSA